MSESSLREQVAAIVAGLPEATCGGDRHLTFTVRYVPAYLGARGWVGVRLDVGRVDWAGIRELITDAHRLQAPRTLVAQLDG